MNIILQVCLVLFLGTLGMYIFTVIANFFGIGFQFYGVYALFIITFVLLYFILPGQYPNIFLT
jgi:hypothetical protein